MLTFPETACTWTDGNEWFDLVADGHWKLYKDMGRVLEDEAANPFANQRHKGEIR